MAFFVAGRVLGRYGDDWRFVVEVLGIGNKEPGVRYPRLLKKVGVSPQQYGGLDGADDEVE